MVHRNQFRENYVHEVPSYQQIINKAPSKPQTSTEPGAIHDRSCALPKLLIVKIEM